ncbi:unnamed protein product [Auanema sp. JU1783]|nr:unnamed protein product [Auanema sp. JU1783]
MWPPPAARPIKRRTSSDDSEMGGPSLSNSDGLVDYSILSRCAAEFFCVLIFTFAGSMQAQGAEADGLLHAALTHGFMLFLLIAAFGGISGAHVNPAVTIGITAVGKLPVIECIVYVLSQLSGSIVGATLTRAVCSYSTYVSIQGGATILSEAHQWYQGLLVETFATFLLVMVILLTAVDKCDNLLAPLAIGLTVAVDILAIGNVSGGSMNPARSFGPNIVGSIFIKANDLSSLLWAYHWIYYIGPCTGSIIASIIYKTFFAREARVFD